MINATPDLKIVSRSSGTAIVELRTKIEDGKNRAGGM